MYKAMYKPNNAHESWITIGSYGSESDALNVAAKKKSSGAFMVRVVDKNGNTIYSAWLSGCKYMYEIFWICTH